MIIKMFIQLAQLLSLKSRKISQFYKVQYFFLVWLNVAAIYSKGQNPSNIS